MFDNIEFMGKFGDSGDDDMFALRREFARAMMKEANGQAFAMALADNEHPIAQMLVEQGNNIRRVFGNELRNMAVPLLFSEREEISVTDFFLRGVKDDDTTEDIAGKLKLLLDFVKEGRKSVELFDEVVRTFPVVDRLAHTTGEGQASGLDAWLSAYSDEEYEVGLWGLALMAIGQAVVGDEPEAINELLEGMPDGVVALCGKIIVSYRMMFHEFLAGAFPAIALMREKLYNSL